ncbi:Gfo/Idh/MocA family protein [Cohnella caldifontis]|uniref:Gfo/Idh/MocA family protein n=1 Tax=Cohnella caldifontis TaxID=3027471 RepID=UPI0023EB1699|nr:Gfo/Idh/MocA family oxidoreductase [Cohnella sp. YIM B05605]
MNPVKTGIIGTGFSGSFHVEALRRVPGVQIVAVSGSSLEKAKAFADQYGIPKAYGSPEELIADPEVQAVHNCTPNDMHFRVNKQVLQAGKHLLSEKPLTKNSRESLELLELSRRSEAVNGVCFNYRHFPIVQQTREYISRGDFGKANLVYGGYTQDWLLYDTDYSWRLDTGKNGLSRAIADIGSHWCDTVQHILGQRIVELCADLKTVHPVRQKPKGSVATFSGAVEAETEPVDVKTEDYGSVLVHFENGTQGVFTVSQVSAGRKNRLYFEIAAETAALAWDQEEPNNLWIGRRDEANRQLVRDPGLLSRQAAELAHYPGGHQEGWPDGMKNLLLDFYKAVRAKEAGEPVSPSFASIGDGHYTMKIIDAILKSHAERRWVKVDE